MILKRKILLILLSVIWIPSFAQTQDSIRCYTINELRVIALSLVTGQECKELLEIAEQEIAFKDSIFAYSQRRAENYERQLQLKDSLIQDSTDLIEDMQQALNEEIRSHVITKRKWRIGTGIVIGTALFFIVTK